LLSLYIIVKQINDYGDDEVNPWLIQQLFADDWRRRAFAMCRCETVVRTSGYADADADTCSPRAATKTARASVDRPKISRTSRSRRDISLATSTTPEVVGRSELWSLENCCRQRPPPTLPGWCWCWMLMTAWIWRVSKPKSATWQLPLQRGGSRDAASWNASDFASADGCDRVFINTRAKLPSTFATS